MNDQFTRQAQDMLAAAKEARIPENVQAFAEDSVAKIARGLRKMNAATQDRVKAMQEIMLAAQAGAKIVRREDAAYGERQRRSRFRCGRGHGEGQDRAGDGAPAGDFIQQQLATASAQTKEFFELSNKIGRQTLESMNAVASKTFEQMKNAG